MIGYLNIHNSHWQKKLKSVKASVSTKEYGVKYDHSQMSLFTACHTQYSYLVIHGLA